MNLTKRKNYYYLSHSFRAKGRVIHRERYIGREIPENIEAIKEKFLRECMQEDLFKKLNKIKKNFQNEWTHYPESIKKEILIGIFFETQLLYLNSPKHRETIPFILHFFFQRLILIS